MGFCKNIHPCVTQYGECKYGHHCKYATLPDDICLNYLSGGCAFGTDCVRSHSLHGIDLKEVFPENFQALRYASDGKRYYVPTKTPEKPPRCPSPPKTSEVICTSVPKNQGPSRYAAAIRSQSFKSQAKFEKIAIAQPYRLNEKSSAQTAKLHPCIIQLGSCKYGDICAHRRLNGNVCVFWLNGGCKNPRCTYAHRK
ncbi:cycling sequence binding protein [Perkinsela sp. CCAP 1560/4]|nr:cycling sequence binding protein [Perkinsela sp. CCAP 1560/4]|eukprot:KNH03640.1 cycling sequence binding protein [Perkinsela sp. CCAP 1560/4]